MSSSSLESALHFPLGEALPVSGNVLPVAPGVLWVRMALPFARSLDTRLASRAVAFMTVAFGVGQIAAPVLAASLAQGRGFVIPCVLSSAALLVGAALMAPRFDSKT
jgi:hypothetical protein